MMVRMLLVSLFLFVGVIPSFARESLREVEGVVRRVVDGDTIQVVDRQGTLLKVRLYGIDAPETAKYARKTGKMIKAGQPFGEEAYQALQRRLDNQSVQLSIQAVDRYHRVVALVWLGKRNINQEMVQEGWGWAYRQYLGRPYASSFIALEEQARQQHVGLWQQSNPQPPWEFRRLMRSQRR